LEEYNRPPKDIQQAMVSEDSANAIYETAQREGILDKVSLLAETTGDVMRGALPITQFRTALQTNLGVDEQKARRIAEQIRDTVFQKIAGSLRKIHNLE
jgi:hypothetical protein